MKKLEETEHSQGNFRFAAIAMVPPLTPVFSGGVSYGIRTSICDCAGIGEHCCRSVQRCAGSRMARQRLIDALAATAFEVEHHAGRIDQETGWAYMGIDLSPAPSGDISIGTAIENLTTQPVGMMEP